MDIPLLWVIADTHSGSNSAIAPPGFTTRDGRNIEASPPQLWLYDQWRVMIEHMKASLLGHRKLVVAHLGDATDGNHHHPSVQSLPDILDQESMAVQLLRPVLELADYAIFTYGTDAHEGEAAASGERICRTLGIAYHDWEIRMWFGDVLHDFAHHGRASAREWSSMAASVAAESILTAAQRGEPVPRFVWRGHKHQVDDSGERFENCRALLVPGWQLRNAYVYKTSPNRIAPVGYAICDGTQVTMVRFRPPRKEAIRHERKEAQDGGVDRKRHPKVSGRARRGLRGGK